MPSFIYLLLLTCMYSGLHRLAVCLHRPLQPNMRPYLLAWGETEAGSVSWCVSQEDALQTLRQIFDDQPQSDDDGRSPAAPPHPSGRAGTCHAPFNGEGIRGASPAGGHPTSATSGTEPLAAAAGGCGSAGGGFGAVAFVGSGSGEPSDSCGDASEFLQVNATQVGVNLLIISIIIYVVAPSPCWKPH